MMYLKLQDVKYQYPNLTFTVEDININVNTNSVYGLLGKNGSGKSTVLNLIGGHILPIEGKILLNEQDITKIPAQYRSTSTVFQTLALFPHMTVEKNIRFAIQNSQQQSSSDTKLIEETLSLFNLVDLKDRLPTQMSLGQQQRAAIARSVASGADLLLLDEPTASLDYEMVEELTLILKSIINKNLVTSMIIVSHDRNFILSICDTIGVVENGKIVCEGNINDLKTNPPNKKIAKILGVL